MKKTSEYCRIGHPDRIADIIADTLLDEFLKQDPDSRVALEVFGCHGIITIGGELSTRGYVDISRKVKEIYKSIGYTDQIGVQTNISIQSPEIRDLADTGAGDSGIVIGYATNETKEMLPIEVVLAKRISDKLDEDNRILPDGKVQVTIEGELDFKIENIVVSYQAEKNEDEYVGKVINDVVVNFDDNERDYRYEQKLVHFVIGGFDADTGLTGRKNALWYGPRIPIGGGAFAGKDATKVDRSGAYWARKIAVDQIKNGNDECLVEIAFAIGQDKPISCTINKEDAHTVSVSEMIEELKLNRPLYKVASLKGHFGYIGCPWE